MLHDSCTQSASRCSIFFFSLLFLSLRPLFMSSCTMVYNTEWYQQVLALLCCGSNPGSNPGTTRNVSFFFDFFFFPSRKETSVRA